MRTKKAFTLVEVMVVVVIIGILAALGLPRYTKSVEKSRIARAQAVLDNLKNAELEYYVQYDAYYFFNYGDYSGTEAALGVTVPTDGMYQYGCYYPATPALYAMKIQPPYNDGRIRLGLPGDPTPFRWCFFLNYGDGGGTCFWDEPRL